MNNCCTNLLIFISLIITISATTTPRTRQGNQNGYKLAPGIGHYKFHTNKKVWGAAWKTCQLEGAHLAIINSDEEAALLKELFSAVPNEKYMSVGIHDHFLNGIYITIFGMNVSATGYDKWVDGEPNNEFGKEACGTINHEALLNDDACVSAHVFVCERELTRREYEKNFQSWRVDEEQEMFEVGRRGSPCRAREYTPELVIMDGNA